MKLSPGLPRYLCRPQPSVTVLLQPVQSTLGGTCRQPLLFVDHSNGEWMVRELGWTNGALPQRGLVDLEVAIPLNRSACCVSVCMVVELRDALNRIPG